MKIQAKQYPDAVDGLVLSNTGTLPSDLDESGIQCFTDMMKRIEKSLFIIKIPPFGLVKRSIKKTVLKKLTQQLLVSEKGIMREICNEMVNTLTKEYEIHITLLLKNLQEHRNMEKAISFDSKTEFYLYCLTMISLLTKALKKPLSA